MFIFHQFLETKSKMLSLTLVLTLQDTKNDKGAVRRCWLRRIPILDIQAGLLPLERDGLTGRDCLHQPGCHNSRAETGAIEEWNAHSGVPELSPEPGRP